MWKYLVANRIQYVADADFDLTLGTGQYLGVIPARSYSVVYRSPRVVDWHEAEGVRRFVILKLSHGTSP